MSAFKLLDQLHTAQFRDRTGSVRSGFLWRGGSSFGLLVSIAMTRQARLILTKQKKEE